ncbi:hypothetical protein [Homoserinibacter sp. GY 40078]|uniref:hypothetical protein n=1 Tax=Homoserinibacter sp. GY 40078 TaxID=2603275 RepID=UPI0011CAF761|nr:hypothetical protein [Homoserinibacter sp. GY 40078]TXK19779.1 hypothetical protein FVQ89_07940 [Homoserinibacter sp. GY 40078]
MNRHFYYHSILGWQPAPPSVLEGLDVSSLLVFARYGDYATRTDLAAIEPLDREVAEILIADGPIELAWTIAMNRNAPPDVLERLAERGGDFVELVGGNPAAPSRLKEGLPLSDHVQVSLEAYVRDMGGTHAQHMALIKAWLSYETTPLGEVWARITGSV